VLPALPAEDAATVADPATRTGPAKAWRWSLLPPPRLWHHARSLEPARDTQATAPRTWGWLALLTAVAAAVRAIGLNQQLWYDEILTLVEFVRLPLAQIVASYSSQNQHMLFSVLARLSVVAFGEAPWSLRLPAALLGVACVPALYFCARQLTSRFEALSASALLAVSYHHVWFSQSARGYTGLALAAIATTHLFARATRGGGLGSWLAFGVVGALGMAVHLSMGFILAGQGLAYGWRLLALRRTAGGWPAEAWGAAAGFALVGALGVTLYAPVLRALWSGTVGAARETVPSEWTNPVWFLLEILRGLARGAGTAGLAAVALAGALTGTGAWSYWRQDRHALGLIVLPCAVTAAAMLALSRNLWPRFFFFAIGFAIMFLVRGAVVWAGAAARAAGRPARARAWGGALVALLAAGSAWQTRTAVAHPKQDFRGAMAYVDAERREGDAVVVLGLAALPYRRYYGRDWPQVESAQELRAVQASSRRVWALYTLPIQLQSRAPGLWSALREGFETQRVFRGTMGGGEVVVLRSGES